MEEFPEKSRRATTDGLEREHEEAVWSSNRRRALRLPIDVLAGELGPKGDISAKLRHNSARSVREDELIPMGGAPGSGHVISRLVFGTIAVAAIVLGLLIWVTS